MVRGTFLGVQAQEAAGMPIERIGLEAQDGGCHQVLANVKIQRDKRIIFEHAQLGRSIKLHLVGVVQRCSGRPQHIVVT